MNRFFTLLLVASCLTAVGQVPDYVPTDGLVAWYEFNSDLEDLGPNQNHGQSSSISYGEDVIGNNQSSLRLELGEYVDLGLIDLLLNGAEDQMTMTFWSKPNDGSIITISKYQNGNSSGSSWEVFDIWSQGVRVLGNGTETGGNPAWFEVCPQTTTNWSHIAVVLDFGVSTIWVNGNFICERPIPTSEVTSPQPVLIGRSNCSNGSGCNDSSGLVDKLGFWSRPLTEEEILVLYNTTAPILGCTDTTACNFNTNANSDDGSCHFNCQFCLTGTVWSEDMGGCIGDGSGDINLDGCVQLNDLLDLLSAYGDCGAEESVWQCGDPLEYQGYDYETVQIGEQCWFAENLRSENYENGDAIPSGLSNSEWTSTASGATAVYGEYAGCYNTSPDINACDPAQSLNEYGRLYNWYSVDDARGLCPSGWYVPSDSEWSRWLMI